MAVLTLEGIVEHGQIKLTTPCSLPDHTKVYVIIPDLQVLPSARLASPRLRHPTQMSDFEMTVTQEPEDAGV